MPKAYWIFDYQLITKWNAAALTLTQSQDKRKVFATSGMQQFNSEGDSPCVAEMSEE